MLLSVSRRTKKDERKMFTFSAQLYCQRDSVEAIAPIKQHRSGTVKSKPLTVPFVKGSTWWKQSDPYARISVNDTAMGYGALSLRVARWFHLQFPTRLVHIRNSDLATWWNSLPKKWVKQNPTVQFQVNWLSLVWYPMNPQTFSRGTSRGNS